MNYLIWALHDYHGHFTLSALIWSALISALDSIAPIIYIMTTRMKTGDLGPPFLKSAGIFQLY
jgi:hypothetical protein